MEKTVVQLKQMEKKRTFSTFIVAFCSDVIDQQFVNIIMFLMT